MALELVILPRAERDAQSIFAWISERSPDGAVRWWNAFEEAAVGITGNPARYGLAPEDGLVIPELRQFLFRTRRGRTYRRVFTVVGDEIRIVRVRGPGQPPLEPDELSFA